MLKIKLTGIGATDIAICSIYKGEGSSYCFNDRLYTFKCGLNDIKYGLYEKNGMANGKDV